ncbi:MAG: DNA-directed RNA polymerase subunit omega [Verrucomicrobia bacterium]|nr:DNA-directed RNA polymerase subunit omega [Verrucomicrobiota bacterium]
MSLNPFQLVLIGAERARQLMRGSRPMIQTRANHPSAIVLEEFASGLLKAEPLDEVPIIWSTPISEIETD